MKILVTGGAGYIGSQFVRNLVKTGNEAIVVDNLSRGHLHAVPPGLEFWQIDLLDYDRLLDRISSIEIDGIVHFAGFAYVGESVSNPELYYVNNVIGSLNLLRAAKNCGIKKFVFSSTCSVYGNPKVIPISEEAGENPINPYAQTKLTIEKILHAFYTAYGINYVILRYFNAAGADVSGEHGESHNPEPHLIPNVLFATLDKEKTVNIFGDDYDTLDGTCIRDYIHIADLADAHLKALEYLNNDNKPDTFNLGTGEGNSVLEIIKLAEKFSDKKINYKICGRREGDPAVLVAESSKAKKILGWKPQCSIHEIIETAWKWHQNPKY
ncbi:MAG: UDP-glucose 4-epimerase GalE [bacterium]